MKLFRPTFKTVVKTRSHDNKEKCDTFLSIFFAININTVVMPVNFMNSLRWLKQKFASHPVTRGVAEGDLENNFNGPGSSCRAC